MKINVLKYVIPMAIGVAVTATCKAGGNAVGAPMAIAQIPAADLIAPVIVPSSYVWDGYENVGEVNGLYYYQGPDNAWISMDTQRLDRFQAWAAGHPNWRTYAVHTDRYRSGGAYHARPAPAGATPSPDNQQPAPANPQ